MTTTGQQSLEQRIKDIDNSLAERERTLLPTVKYRWEVEQEARAGLEQQSNHWHKQFMRASGQLATMKRALEAICEVYPHTGTSGDSMARIAHEALGKPYVDIWSRK